MQGIEEGYISCLAIKMENMRHPVITGLNTGNNVSCSRANEYRDRPDILI